MHFLQIFIQWLNGKSSGPIQLHQNALLTVLQASPYPALQLLQLLHERSKLHIGQIISTLLRQLLDGDVASPRSFCVLANFPASVLEASTLRQKLMTRLVVDSITSEHLMLTMLARSDGQLLDDLLHEQQLTMRAQCSEAAPTKLLVLWLALNEREFISNHRPAVRSSESKRRLSTRWPPPPSWGFPRSDGVVL